MNLFYKMPRIAKYTVTESKLVVARDCGEKKRGMTA